MELPRILLNNLALKAKCHVKYSRIKYLIEHDFFSLTMLAFFDDFTKFWPYKELFKALSQLA